MNTNSEAFKGMQRRPCDQKPVEESTVMDVPPNGTDSSSLQSPALQVVLPSGSPTTAVNEEVKDDMVKELANMVKCQTETINALGSMVKMLAEQIQTLMEQGATKSEYESIKTIAGETRTILTQYVNTNALPHDVLKLLQKENESMVHKLEIRPQIDILRGVRDLYVQMSIIRERCEKAGNTDAVKILDILSTTIREDIFEEYGVEILLSEEGAPFKALRMTKGDNVPTDCKEKHMHVAYSQAIGFQFEKEVLLKERVALYDCRIALENEMADTEDTVVKDGIVPLEKEEPSGQDDSIDNSTDSANPTDETALATVKNENSECIGK